MGISRRTFLAGTAGFGVIGAASGYVWSKTTENKLVLQTGKSQAQILPPEYPKTDVWAYNQQLPGPMLRYKQGGTFNAQLQNGLDIPTTIHWHGLRLPNEMDGVPMMTQKAVMKDERFDYKFKLKDAGTFWYHPHHNSFEQVDRGLSGVLVVDEEDPIVVDQDMVWVLDDWRLQEDGKIVEDYTNRHDKSHAGRIGNVVGVNGTYNPTYTVQNGERLRVRLVNASNARIYTPYVPQEKVWVIAFDGQPIDPVPLKRNMLRLGPGMRADLIIDMDHNAYDALQVIDTTYNGRETKLVGLKVNGFVEPHRGAPKRLADNPHNIPDLANAERREVVYQGGAMGRMAEATLNGGDLKSIRELVEAGAFWTTNGNTYDSMAAVIDDKRLFQLKLGQSYIFKLHNKTNFAHPIHLHGHTFQLITRNEEKLEKPMWQDTVLIWPNERVEIAFVADNPGHWMFHCHILDHASAGMMAAIQVS